MPDKIVPPAQILYDLYQMAKKEEGARDIGQYVLDNALSLRDALDRPPEELEDMLL